MKSLLSALRLRLSRRKRWESQTQDALLVASHAARKLQIELHRGSVEPKAEYDRLIAILGTLQHLRQGPDRLDQAPRH